MFPGEFPFFAGLLNFHWSIRNQITIFYQLYRHQPPFSHDFPQVFPGFFPSFPRIFPQVFPEFSQVVPIQNPQRRPKDYELLVFSEQDTVFVPPGPAEGLGDGALRTDSPVDVMS